MRTMARKRTNCLTAASLLAILAFGTLAIAQEDGAPGTIPQVATANANEAPTAETTEYVPDRSDVIDVGPKVIVFTSKIHVNEVTAKFDIPAYAVVGAMTLADPEHRASYTYDAVSRTLYAVVADIGEPVTIRHINFCADNDSFQVTPAESTRLADSPRLNSMALAAISMINRVRHERIPEAWTTVFDNPVAQGSIDVKLERPTVTATIAIPVVNTVATNAAP